METQHNPNRTRKILKKLQVSKKKPTTTLRDANDKHADAQNASVEYMQI